MKTRIVSAVLGLFLALALVALAAPAGAEMYVEGYLGGTAAANMGQAFTIQGTGSGGGVIWTEANHLQFPGSSEPTVLGGLKLGTWFVHEGFAGYSGYPDWMKYFGFYTDFSFQKLEMRSQNVSGTYRGWIGGPYWHGLNWGYLTNNFGTISSEGSIATWAFMFAGRYGFFPDAQVPFGRLQPYVAVGPAIMFSHLTNKISTWDWYGFTWSNVSGGNQSSTNIALAVDAGIRYMALKNVSIDLSFKYRYAQPSFGYTGWDWASGNTASYKLNPVYSLFSGQLGVAYHF